jgi:hypothetical protein
MTIPSRYDTSDNIQKVNTTLCITCGKFKDYTEFYARRTDECMDCIDAEKQESDAVWRRNRPEAMRY